MLQVAYSENVTYGGDNSGNHSVKKNGEKSGEMNGGGGGGGNGPSYEALQNQLETVQRDFTQLRQSHLQLEAECKFSARK